MWYVLTDLSTGPGVRLSYPLRSKRDALREAARLARLWRTTEIQVRGSARRGYTLTNPRNGATAVMYVGKKGAGA